MGTPPDHALVVPVKGGPLAKSRLDLPEGTRRAFAEAFARDTLAAAATALPDAVVLVVTSDRGVRLGVTADGFRVVDDPGEGLDPAVAAGFAAAVALGAGTVGVLLADHPALRPEELLTALAAARGRGPVVVPDADGTGTALLVLPLVDPAGRPCTVPPTRFGPGSAAAHEGLGWERVEVDAPGLRGDVDDAASFAEAIAAGVGPHTRAALARATLPGVQATIHRIPGDEGGSALLDDGREVAVPLAALVDSGLLHLRVGQRVSLELDDAEAAATRVWIVGIGPGETIR
ncbi:2-phospho-L-lactate guanylyltransferase [Phycicoccus sonneratiae]|uniref:2-phospho-L-lactate guanylyltransferase n=1 Tax=Phycicoccus sonneratiae TaxID=2807628 RepID=A0ABS2CMS4_9MICO|nr:2-phospho-L-lactate guanylyltransferase [Phycicoccus sonneraticus]MBM6400481.1 2-phospho-L-lactate guanylyltransferase [Phycicoccus sonneraticus]